MSKEYNHILIGQEDNKKVYIEYGEYLKILKFSKAGASDGCRGVLLGYKNNDGIFILKALEALYVGSEGMESPAFSPEAWGRITAEAKENFSGLAILGQFSSHKSIAPDRMDYIMQEKFFGKENNLLFIFDPTDNTEKMYIYNRREFLFLNGFYLFDKFEKPINLKHRESIVNPLSREYELRMRLFDDIKRKIKRQNNIYAVFLIIIILLTFYNIIHSYELEQRISYIYREKIEWNKELKSLEN